MSKMARTMAAIVGGTLASASLQAAPLPGFSLTTRSEHFSFFSRDGQKVDARKSERFLSQVERLLGHKLAGRAEYYRYATPEEIAVGTGTYAQGVTFAQARQVHSTREFHAHEIVHLVAGQIGNPGAFFQEGLAVALGNEGRWNGERVDKIAKPVARAIKIPALVASFDRVDSQTAYAVAGSFVARIIRVHGGAKVTEFFRAANGRNTSAAFAKVFGQSLDEASAAWAASL